MDREKAIRAAFFTPLDGNLNYSGSEVKIFDQKFEPNANSTNYVLISNQSSQDQGNFNCFRWTSRITLQVISKTQSSVSSDVVDDIGEQIENIIFPGNPSQNGLTQQTGWQILNVALESVNYTSIQITDTNSVITKILTFSLTITKT
jgi:hypothetical protein